MTPRIQALLHQVHSGKLQTDMARILHHIKKHPYTTLSELKRKLNMKHQTASARVSDLLDMGLIEEKDTKKSHHSFETYFTYQSDIRKQEHNAKKRKKTKYQHWLKKGLSQFEDLINPELKQELKQVTT